MEPDCTLNIAVVVIGDKSDPSGKIAEAVKLYKGRHVDRIYLQGKDFSRLINASKVCLQNQVLLEDLIFNEPDLTTFVRDCEEGIHLLVVLTTWLEYIWTWYRYRRLPGWVWSPTKFYVVGIR